MEFNFEDFKKISLEPDDKKIIRNELADFISLHPVRKPGFLRLLLQRRADGNPLPKLKLILKPMPILVLLSLLIGGGTALAAEKSLPGDTLYPVKNLTENVRGLAMLSDKTRAAWQTSLVERRLNEIEKLYNEGKLTEEAKNKAEQKIKNSVSIANSKIEDLKNKGKVGTAAGLATKMENSLEAHEKNINKMVKKLENRAQLDEKFSEKIKEQADKIRETREKFEEKIAQDNGADMKSAAENKLAAAQNKIEEVKKFIENKNLSGDDLKKAQEEILQAENKLAEGKKKLEAGKYGEAFLDFQAAHKMVQEAKFFIHEKNKPDSKPEKSK
ncbi:MAG: hypothetical protein WC459_00915 [Patescibacteria group bacterium]